MSFSLSDKGVLERQGGPGTAAGQEADSGGGAQGCSLRDAEKNKRVARKDNTRFLNDLTNQYRFENKENIAPSSSAVGAGCVNAPATESLWPVGERPRKTGAPGDELGATLTPIHPFVQPHAISPPQQQQQHAHLCSPMSTPIPQRQLRALLAAASRISSPGKSPAPCGAPLANELEDAAADGAALAFSSPIAGAPRSSGGDGTSSPDSTLAAAAAAFRATLAQSPAARGAVDGPDTSVGSGGSCDLNNMSLDAILRGCGVCGLDDEDDKDATAADAAHERHDTDEEALAQANFAALMEQLGVGFSSPASAAAAAAVAGADATPGVGEPTVFLESDNDDTDNPTESFAVRGSKDISSGRHSGATGSTEASLSCYYGLYTASAAADDGRQGGSAPRAGLVSAETDASFVPQTLRASTRRGERASASRGQRSPPPPVDAGDESGQPHWSLYLPVAKASAGSLIAVGGRRVPVTKLHLLRTDSSQANGETAPSARPLPTGHVHTSVGTSTTVRRVGSGGSIPRPRSSLRPGLDAHTRLPMEPQSRRLPSPVHPDGCVSPPPPPFASEAWPPSDDCSRPSSTSLSPTESAAELAPSSRRLPSHRTHTTTLTSPQTIVVGRKSAALLPPPPLAARAAAPQPFPSSPAPSSPPSAEESLVATLKFGRGLLMHFGVWAACAGATEQPLPPVEVGKQYLARVFASSSPYDGVAYTDVGQCVHVARRRTAEVAAAMSAGELCDAADGAPARCPSPLSADVANGGGAGSSASTPRAIDGVLLRLLDVSANREDAAQRRAWVELRHRVVSACELMFRVLGASLHFDSVTLTRDLRICAVNYLVVDADDASWQANVPRLLQELRRELPCHVVLRNVTH